MLNTYSSVSFVMYPKSAIVLFQVDFLNSKPLSKIQISLKKVHNRYGKVGSTEGVMQPLNKESNDLKELNVCV